MWTASLNRVICSYISTASQEGCGHETRTCTSIIKPQAKCVNRASKPDKFNQPVLMLYLWGTSFSKMVRLFFVYSKWQNIKVQGDGHWNEDGPPYTLPPSAGCNAESIIFNPPSLPPPHTHTSFSLSHTHTHVHACTHKHTHTHTHQHASKQACIHTHTLIKNKSPHCFLSGLSPIHT